mmetsp:Transcript_7361/g.18326  ORF Transcript_7361/g.18326 Transcript_7361/m.18326 type:complete len:95 (+) Transcript_7361:540-824(+)
MVASFREVLAKCNADLLHDLAMSLRAAPAGPRPRWRRSATFVAFRFFVLICLLRCVLRFTVRLMALPIIIIAWHRCAPQPNTAKQNCSASSDAR